MKMKTKTVRNNGGVPDTRVEYQGMGHVRIKGPFTCAAVYDPHLLVPLYMTFNV